MVIRVIAGQVDNSRIFVDINNHAYTIEKISTGKKSANFTLYLKCANKKKFKCSGRGKIVTANKDNVEDCVLENTKPHNHAAEEDLLELKELQQRMKDRVKMEQTEIKKIFDEECLRVSEEAAAKIDFPSISNTLYKCRRKLVPTIPDSFDDFEEAILNTRFSSLKGSSFYETTLVENGNRIAVFVVKPLFQLFKEDQEIHMDGTFQTIPLKPASRQLFTLMGIHQDHAFPLVFAMMTSKNYKSYRTLFRYLRDEHGFQPKSIMSDYEAAIKKAAKKVFPSAKIKGCNFHFSQAIMRRIDRLGYRVLYRRNKIFRKGVRMLIATALLPAWDIPEAIAVIKRYFNGNGFRNKGLVLLSYYKQQWMEKVGCRNFSIHNAPNRTNNHQESFHNVLRKSCGMPHPNVWNFIESLQKLSSTAIVDYKRIEAGGNVKRSKDSFKMKREIFIETEMERYARGGMGIFEFLSRVAMKPRKNADRSGNKNLNRNRNNDETAKEMFTRLSQSGMKITILRKRLTSDVNEIEYQPAKKSRRLQF